MVIDLKTYKKQIDNFCKIRKDMIPVRGYNHYMIDELDKIVKISNLKILDLGASPHGFALERALEKKANYFGIGLDINEKIEIHFHKNIGILEKMNAEKLVFCDNFFDAIITLATFEHFLKPKVVLKEMYRVLKKNSFAFVNFEPIWTSSYGHHLHQWPNILQKIPPWSHLILNKKQFREMLSRVSDVSFEKNISEIVNWVYESNEINRINIKNIIKVFKESNFEIKYMVPLLDNEENNKKIIANYLSKVLPFSEEELFIRGFTILLYKR